MAASLLARLRLGSAHLLLRGVATSRAHAGRSGPLCARLPVLTVSCAAAAACAQLCCCDPLLDLIRGDTGAMGHGASLKEIAPGEGRMAELGMWATCHYRMTLVGDGTLLEDTRHTGKHDREYGQPYEFEVGAIGDGRTTRALHACVLDMREGGRRRVRVQVGDPTFGFGKEVPRLYTRGEHGRVHRTVQPEWLMDIEVELLAVASAPPTRRERLLRWLGIKDFGVLESKS
ncbi:hypothetical protein AB1Y20_004667 [Prymnesium parvum]|uniref:peptidylprolyl isomerase n=1 Tax=Prymnesium parvum TaxID=97485 RepID=A0AB34IZQ7_PRYPA